MDPGTPVGTQKRSVSAVDLRALYLSVIKLGQSSISVITLNGCRV